MPPVLFHSEAKDEGSGKGVTHTYTLEAGAGEFPQIHIQPTHTLSKTNKTR